MKASSNWLNDYLDPPCPADEQGEMLTMAGFPVEGREAVSLPDGSTDICTDFETTSNRGDCLCHLGLAREIAAISGRSLKSAVGAGVAVDTAAAAGDRGIQGSPVRVINHEPERCPLYTARIIRGVKVGPSPEWLANRLRAIGQIPRNNIVDATNFVLFELGQPTHVFDLAKIGGGEINIRLAQPGEMFLPIGEGAAPVKLTDDDLVIADAEVPVAIGGVKGGALSAVTSDTTDLLIEAATFDVVTVRNSSRRHRIVSDSSYRYERGVHAAEVNPAAERLVEIILEVAGGELLQGVAAGGAPIPEPRVVSMRPDRCRAILGVEIDDPTIIEYLTRLGFDPKMGRAEIQCTVPSRRLDIEREIDLIEEISRMYGHGNIPVDDRIPIRIAPPQSFIAARRAVNDVLVGMGFVETVTHSLVSEKHARPFLAAGASLLSVDQDRAGLEPVLRPSVVPSLLRVRAFNEDRGTKSLMLFESAATFARASGDAAAHQEVRTLGMVMDVEDKSLGLRPLRGVIERLASLILGHEADVTLASSPDCPWLAPGAAARVCVNGHDVGWIGLLSRQTRTAFDLQHEILAAEVGLEAFYNVFPPETEVRELPSFPSIERDISAIVDEAVLWQEVSDTIAALRLDHLESAAFITTFRGGGIGAGRKSLTLRLRFRAPDRTLRHDEVDPQVEHVMGMLASRFSAAIRT